ncbi:hypothetical protein ABB37_05452 [Leptomonas pyrrhocoris]|uniref:Uncharacterized protein n=1 Tax=Leptomonas pyrrhocoris TaxID=157538 RepID=A0A0N1J4S6_LEPPY|nr:hypothetical protein ABB37_05452 [Leptomonas pyrrhocoris]KPA79671.1 hypothetical protein ABB37_05452 [Leptomonas pyrrhocoris]|eukprot:XP_015658110.1 hypothetical protein ABB37_05452 [Leptomonas pyrrhocoris]
MAESTAISPSSPWWWTHCSVAEAAEPLDPTADDAAAAALASITAQTAQHTLAHAELLCAYLASTHADTASAAADIYAQLKLDAVLVPLLCQLRKAMAQAWEERAAEQAEAAAAEGAAPPLPNASSNNISSNGVATSFSSPSSSPLPPAATQESVVAAACADPVLLRRLRVLQQQIYVAFFKAVLRGLTSGVRSAVALYETEAVVFDGVARGVALLLDGFCAQLMEAATTMRATANAPTPTSASSEEVQNARRGHRSSNSFASASSFGTAAGAHVGSSANDWLTGMMPLYVRAAERSAQVVGGETDTAEAPAPARPPIPSPSLCLVSYVGVFLQGAGLQLLPSEQAAQLPLFTAIVHRVALAQLKQRCAAAMTDVTEAAAATVLSASSTSLPPSSDKGSQSAAAAVAHIKSASLFLQHLTDAQLYSEEHGTEMEDDDCTTLFRAPPFNPPRSVTGTEQPAGSGAAVVDYSVASLAALTTYQACSQILSHLEKWWTLCRRLLAQARAEAGVQAASAGEHDEGKEEQEANPSQTELAQGAALLKEAEDAWLLLRRHAMTASVILSNYAETTLLLAPFAALLTRLFYSPSGDDEATAAVSQGAWKACIRELHHVTRTIYSCSDSSGHGAGASRGSTGVAAASAVSARPLRPRYRNVGNYTFAVASYLRVPTVLSDAAGRSVLSTTENAHPTCSADVTPKVLPLAFSLLHQPLTVLRDRVWHMLITPGVVNLQLKVDTIVGEKGSVADRSTSSPAAAAANAAATSSIDGSSASTSTAVAASATSARARAASDQPMTAAEIVELCFPRHYRLLHAMDLAMQYCVSRAQELAEAAAATAAADAWVPAGSLPSLFAQFFGAALDEAFIAQMRSDNDEVCGSEVLMFYAAVFRTLPRDALSSLRAALSTFLGHAGVHLLEYIRYHIVDQQRYGFAAFFLPPLRALGLDYSTVEDTDISLALAANPPHAHAMAYAWELPRLFFWKHDSTPAAEVAWSAHGAAQQYLCELMTQEPPVTPAFMKILAEASEVAHRRCYRKAGDNGAKRAAASTAKAAATDAMTAVFLAFCRWCAVQLSALAATPSPSSAVPRASISAALATLIGASQRAAAATAAQTHPVLVALHAQLREAIDEADEEQAEPSTFSSRVVAWFWTCSYDAVAPAHLQSCARRLLRDFSVQFGQRAPIKTVLGIRAMVEQQLKADEVAASAVALRKLKQAMEEDVKELLECQQKHEKQQEEARETVEDGGENAVKDETPAADDAPQMQDDKTVESAELAPPSSAASAALQTTAAAPVLAPAELRGYVDQLLTALVTRAQLSPVDGAISAAVLGLFLQALSDSQLPIQMSAQDRQRMCERFVFTVTSTIPDLTRAETLSSACSLHLVFENTVFPFKKSFLETTPSLRAFHGSLSDNESDAFKLVQHTLGDVLTAFQKCQSSDGTLVSLSGWKAVLLLEQTAPFLLLVRSLLEKVRVSIRKAVLKKRSPCVELLHLQLTRMEKEAVREGRNVADDVLHLFTHHPPPSPVSAAATTALRNSSSSTRAIRSTPPTAAAAASPSTVKREATGAVPTSTARGSPKRPRGGRRVREEELRRAARQRNAAAAPGNGSSGSERRRRDEGGDGDGRRNSERKREREDDTGNDGRRDTKSDRGSSRRGGDGRPGRSGRHRR